MKFVVCWTCGMSTRVIGKGQDAINSATSVAEHHACSKPDMEIISKSKRTNK